MDERDYPPMKIEWHFTPKRDGGCFWPALLLVILAALLLWLFW
jgi:hypothetical protein